MIDDQSNPPTWKYVVAWCSTALLGNLLNGIFVTFIFEFNYDAELTYKISAFTALFVYLGVSWVVYAKLFPTLNMYKVMGWFYFLGSIGAAGGIGQIGEEIRELGGQFGIVELMHIVSWVVYLVLFRHYFKNIAEGRWTPKTKSENTSDW